MKVTRIIITCSAVLATALLVLSCFKETGKEVALESNDFGNTTLVQVFNATVGSTGTVHVFVDAVPVTGAALTYGNVFPSSSYAFSVSAGLRSFSIRDLSAVTTQAPLIFAENMDVGKNYTIFMYDTTTTAKQVLVKNDIVIPSDTTARVKFANFSYLKSSTAPNVDIFSKRRNANIFSDIPPTKATDYIPYASGVADSLIVRATGTGIALDTAVLTFTRKRSYTLIFRGRYANNEGGGATFPRTLSSFPNY